MISYVRKGRSGAPSLYLLPTSTTQILSGQRAHLFLQIDWIVVPWRRVRLRVHLFLWDPPQLAHIIYNDMYSWKSTVLHFTLLTAAADSVPVRRQLYSSAGTQKILYSLLNIWSSMILIQSGKRQFCFYFSLWSKYRYFTILHYNANSISYLYASPSLCQHWMWPTNFSHLPF